MYGWTNESFNVEAVGEVHFKHLFKHEMLMYFALLVPYHVSNEKSTLTLLNFNEHKPHTHNTFMLNVPNTYMYPFGFLNCSWMNKFVGTHHNKISTPQYICTWILKFYYLISGNRINNFFGKINISMTFYKLNVITLIKISHFDLPFFTYKDYINRIL